MKDGDAADKIDGDRSFRIAGGYDLIATLLLRSIADHLSVVHLNSTVERVKWRRGSVAAAYRSALDGQPGELRCRHLIVTVPLGVLQAGAIEFTPEPTTLLRAARALKFGTIYRVTFRFGRAF